MRKYARCEWKCFSFIGTDDWGKIVSYNYKSRTGNPCGCPKPVPMNEIHCSGQRGDYGLGNDPRRPN